MQKFPILSDICQWLMEFINSTVFRDTYRVSENNFVRQRKLPLKLLVLYILNNQKCSLQAGLNSFWETIGLESMPCSMQSFSKRRQYVKPEGIAVLLRSVCRKFYECANYRTWKNQILLAIDGSRYNLPCTKATAEAYGVQKSQGTDQVQGLGSNIYDVLNNMILDSTLNPCRSNERELVLDHLDYLADFPLPKDGAVIILDRGYPSAKLIHEMQCRNFKYIMRCSSEFLSAVRVTGDDCVVTHRFSAMKHQELTFRVLHIPLNGHKDELLITNLFDETLTIDDFRELYHLRWNIETAYRTEKCTLEIENFSGETLPAISQDYYATGFLYNIAQVIHFELQEEFEQIHNDGSNTLKYKQNLSKTIQVLKKYIVRMLYESTFFCDVTLMFIQALLLRSVTAVRPDRSCSRAKKHLRAIFSKQYKHY